MFLLLFQIKLLNLSGFVTFLLKEKHPKSISSLWSGHNQKFKPVKNQLNNLENPIAIRKLRKQVSENQKIYSYNSLFSGHSLRSDSRFFLRISLRLFLTLILSMAKEKRSKTSRKRNRI